MSNGGCAAKEHKVLETESSVLSEATQSRCDTPGINLLLEQLTYCIALAKRLADAALAEASKK